MVLNYSVVLTKPLRSLTDVDGAHESTRFFNPIYRELATYLSSRIEETSCNPTASLVSGTAAYQRASMYVHRHRIVAKTVMPKELIFCEVLVASEAAMTHIA